MIMGRSIDLIRGRSSVRESPSRSGNRALIRHLVYYSFGKSIGR